MDKVNETLKSMFDMVGNSLKENIRSLSNAVMSQQQQQELNSVTQSSSTTSTISSFPADKKSSRGSLKSSKLNLSRSKSVITGKQRRSKNKRLRQRPSVQTCGSMYQRASATKKEPFASGLEVFITDPDRARSFSNNRYSCAVYFIHCEKHRKVAVTKPTKKQAVWMPFMPIPANKSWFDSGLLGLYIVISNGNMDNFMAIKTRLPFQTCFIAEVASIEIPQTLEIINRITWLVTLNDSSKFFKCCVDNESLIWIDDQKIDTGMLDYMWGPELIDVFRSNILLDPNNQKPKCTFVEYDIESAFQFLPHNPARTDEEAMLISSNLFEKDIERLYSDFLDHCFPAMSMTFHSFKVYMTKYGFDFEDERLTHLFIAFNYNANGSITFPELLMGLACIDIHSVHNEVRAKFVMRYYDVRKRGYLTSDDIRQMLLTIHSNLSFDEIDIKLEEIIKQMELSPIEPDKVSYRAFVTAIGNHKFRGTSRLCRSERPVFQMISNIIFSRKKKSDDKGLKLSEVIDPYDSNVCSGCREKMSTFNETLLTIDKNGYVSNKRKVKIRKSELKIKSESSQNSKPRSRSFRSRRNATINVPEEVKEIARNMIRSIKDFLPNKGDTRHPNGIMSGTHRERQRFYETLSTMEKYLCQIFENETRCVWVNSPAVVIGDIHGNIEDLLTLEKCFWKRFPAIDVNLVFLGDYVDRGRWSIECVTYLFAMKILMPNKLTMLRGNHEVRPLQAHYSYRLECFAKYGDEYGYRVWEVTNRIFDCLPLCAAIDESIFCAHGGIPRSAKDISDIQKISSDIDDPEHKNRIAWEILWSDPIHQQQFLELACILNISEIDQNDGYLPNRKRGTAFVFNETAASNFLMQNSLSHIIRAHEVPSNGFFFHFNKKCSTIFSCSHYCGNNNEAAVAFIEGDLIRVIRIDTANNSSATDM